MPFSIKIKGKTVEAKPSDYDVTSPPDGAFPFDVKDHADALAWTSYIAMCVARNEAVALWIEAQELDEQIESRPDHPKRAAAVKKLMKLRDNIGKKQLEYLKQERAANYCWQCVSIRDRERFSWTHWFNTPAKKEHLYGSWYTFFESADKPPSGFHIDPTPLQFCPPEQSREYNRIRLGGDYYDPED